VTPTRAPIIIGGLLQMSSLGLASTTWMQAEPPAPLSDASSVRFGLNYPSRMQAGLSETIAVTLTRNAQGTVQATLGTPGIVNLVVSPVPVGTPGAPLQQARGANYSAFAVARIPATSGVQVQLSSPSNEEQSLDNETITWYWSVVSQTPGTRKMRLDFELRFKPKASGAPSVPDQPMWSPEIEIDVRDQNVLAVGPLSIPTNNLGQTIVQAGLGSQIPLIIAWVRGKLQRKPAEPPVPPKRKRGKTA
jgi:hypothetical protein